LVRSLRFDHRAQRSSSDRRGLIPRLLSKHVMGQLFFVGDREGSV